MLCGGGWTSSHCPFGIRPETPDDLGRPTADGDADGYVDACDRCPGAPDGPHLADPDVDGDRILDGCDVCPRRESGRDCNRDAELVAGELVIDDVCDTRPCGDAQVRSETRTIGGDAGETFTRIDVDPVAAERVSARAGARFCWCTAAEGDRTEDRFRCVAPLLDGSGGCGLGREFVATYDARSETADNTWRRPGVSWPDSLGVAGTGEAALSFEPTAGHFTPSATATWSMNSDLPRWSALIGVDLGAAHPDAVPGVVWIHSPGPPAVRGTTGFFEDDLRALTSHYSSGSMPRPVSLAFEVPRADLGITPVVPFLPTCPGCPDRCPWCRAAFPGAWLFAAGDRVVSNVQGLVRDQASAFDAATLEEVKELRDVPWIASSEPDELLDREGLRWAAIAPDGSNALTVLAGTRLGYVDVSFLPPGYFDQRPPQPGEMVTLLDPPSRARFGAVLSAMRFRLWIVGGVDTATGESRGDLWAFDVLSGRWTYVNLEGDPRPAAVLAATYSPAHDALFVLDEEAGDVRLLRIDPLSGSIAVVSRFRPRRIADRWAMGADRAGALYVATSSAGELAHRVVRLGSDGALQATRNGPGQLASGELRANEQGLTLLTRRDGGLPAPIAYRYDELLSIRGRAPTWP